jgi:transposase-like protein
MDRGERPGVTTEMTEKMKALERENRELKQANEILRKGETIFRHWSEELPVVAPLV